MHRKLYHQTIVLLLFNIIGANINAQLMYQRGSDYALFFAVHDYKSGKLTNLPNTLKNANEIATVLRDHYGFKTEIVINPTMSDIERKLNEYRDFFQNGRLSKDGQLLIYFAGHGVIEYKNGYFLPTDADPNRILRTGMTYNAWRPFISQINCQHILVAIDACYSVTFDPDWESRGKKPPFERLDKLSDDQLLLADHNKYKARIFFTSDAKEDIVPGRSNFARKIIEGLLKERERKGFLTAKELFASYIDKAQPSPQFGDFEGDDPQSNFLFFPLPEVLKIDVKAHNQRQKDIDAFIMLQNHPTIENCQQYLLDFPQGLFQEEVNQQLQELQDKQEWHISSLKGTPAAYKNYLKLYPNGLYAKEANQGLQEEPPPSIQFTPPDHMVFIPGGTFEMGDVLGDGESNEKPTHPVSLSSFYLGKHEVSLAEYAAFCDANQRKRPDNISKVQGKTAVSNVDWYDAIAYCNWRSEQEGLQPVYQIDRYRKASNNINNYDHKKWLVTFKESANGYRLPTEAEWEYAARSKGRNDKWAGTSSLDRLGVYANVMGEGNSYSHSLTVGTLRANDLGLYDMSGNVWEWCWDWYEAYPSSAQINPKGPPSGSYRVMRGGSWSDLTPFLRCTYRGHSDPDYLNKSAGFRLARSAK